MLIAGVDEAGRGPLAGPVVSAAVILNPDKPIQGLRDSKCLTELRREYLFTQICRDALAWAVGEASVEEIDQLNILQATLLSMKRAVDALTITPHRVWVDGNQCPSWAYPTECIVQGDRTTPVISAASILAKVVRDRKMKLLDQEYPEYFFAQNKGYGTRIHLKVLQQRGPCSIHRSRFRPVQTSLRLHTMRTESVQLSVDMVWDICAASEDLT